MHARGLLLALAAAALPLSAAGAGFRRQVAAQWGFDDISVRDKSGSTRSSTWSQGYDAGLSGPLLVPEAGDLDLHGLFRDGFDVGQAVNTPSARRKRWSGSASGELFSDRLRRYVRFAPSASWAQDQQASNNADPTRVRKTETFGFAGGLSLPRLPSLSLARNVSRTRDPSASSPVDEKSLSGSESLGWSLGGWRLGLERFSSSNEDLTGRSGQLDSETRQGHAEYQRYDMKAMGLHSVNLRGDLVTSKYQGQTRQKDLTSSLSVRSRSFVGRGWKHAAGLSDSYYRSGTAASESNAAAADLLSSREARWGSVTNSVMASLAQGGGTSRSASEGLAFTESARKGRLTLNQSLSSGWTEPAGGAAVRSDQASARAGLTPREGRDINLGVRVASTRQQGGGPSTLTQGGDLTANLQVASRLSLTSNIVEDRTRSGSTGLWNISDRASVGLSGAPRPSMTLQLQGSATRTRTGDGHAFQYNSASLNMSWMATRRLTLNGSCAAAGSSLDLAAGLSWTIGRTGVRLSYNRQEISTTRSYKHLSLSVSRSF